MSRSVGAVLVFALAGATLAVGLAVTALAGVVAGSAGPVMPGSYVVLLWVVCGVLGVPVGWFARRQVGWRREEGDDGP